MAGLHIHNIFFCFLLLLLHNELMFIIRSALRCWLTNHRWSQLWGQRSAGALAGNQLLPNAALKRDEKALIDLVDGLSSRSVVLVGVADGDLADHDVRLDVHLCPKKFNKLINK
jgi:hypothetical protein